MVSSVDCKLLLYADDSALIVSGTDPDSIAIKLGDELDSCRQWLIDNKLSLHLGKTECMLFGTKRKLNKVKPRVPSIWELIWMYHLLGKRLLGKS